MGNQLLETLEEEHLNAFTKQQYKTFKAKILKPTAN